MEWSVQNFKKYTFIKFDISNNTTIQPSTLKYLTPPNLVAQNLAHLGVVLSGRGPIWLYAYLTHYYHPTAWVATYDPRLSGAVVVQSHHPDYNVGDVIPIS